MTCTPEMGRAFWYELDRRTAYDAAFRQVYGQAGAGRSQRVFAQTRQQGTYPAALADAFRQHRDQWVVLAEVQTSTISSMLGDTGRTCTRCGTRGSRSHRIAGTGSTT